jgi:hypothetical protein
MWGPLVLAGDLGPERARGRGRESRGSSTNDVAVPVFIAAEKPVTLGKTDQPGHFRSDGVGRDKDVVMRSIACISALTVCIERSHRGMGKEIGRTSRRTGKAAQTEAAVAFAQPANAAGTRFNFQRGFIAVRVWTAPPVAARSGFRSTCRGRGSADD